MQPVGGIATAYDQFWVIYGMPYHPYTQHLALEFRLEPKQAGGQQRIADESGNHNLQSVPPTAWHRAARFIKGL